MNFRRKPKTATSAYRRSPEVTIRWATPADAAQLRNLAAVDEAPLPAPPLLVALVGDELWVAASASTGDVICDPFRPTADVATLVLERRRQLTVSQRRRPRFSFAGLRRPVAAGGLPAGARRT